MKRNASWVNVPKLISIFRILLIGVYLYSELIGSLYGLALLIPTLAVSVRRLHDIGKSGWMILVGLIPVIGWIWLIVLYVQEGHRGTNQYGADPKEGLY